jgi:hypothetical protein
MHGHWYSCSLLARVTDGEAANLGSSTPVSRFQWVLRSGSTSSPWLACTHPGRPRAASGVIRAASPPIPPAVEQEVLAAYQQLGPVAAEPSQVPRCRPTNTISIIGAQALQMPCAAAGPPCGPTGVRTAIGGSDGKPAVVDYRRRVAANSVPASGIATPPGPGQAVVSGNARSPVLQQRWRRWRIMDRRAGSSVFSRL